jgi:hypothetical protein
MISTEPVILFKRPKRRQAGTALLQTLIGKPPTGTLYVAWDNTDSHPADEMAARVRGALGRLVLLHRPTSSPRLNPLESGGAPADGKSPMANSSNR